MTSLLEKIGYSLRLVPWAISESSAMKSSLVSYSSLFASGQPYTRGNYAGLQQEVSIDTNQEIFVAISDSNIRMRAARKQSSSNLQAHDRTPLF